MQSTQIIPTYAVVRLNTTNKNLSVGQTLKLKLTGSTKKVKWISGNATVATVDQKGVVKAKKPGTVSIIAKLNNNINKVCKINVYNKSMKAL